MKNLFQYKIVFFIFFLFFVQFNSQDTKIDDLNNETIEKKIDSLHNNPNKAWEIINLYIKKSKKEKNEESLLYAYRYASNFSQYPENLKYADSALAIGKKSNNKNKRFRHQPSAKKRPSQGGNQAEKEKMAITCPWTGARI